MHKYFFSDWTSSAGPVCWLKYTSPSVGLSTLVICQSFVFQTFGRCLFSAFENCIRHLSVSWNLLHSFKVFGLYRLADPGTIFPSYPSIHMFTQKHIIPNIFLSTSSLIIFLFSRGSHDLIFLLFSHLKTDIYILASFIDNKSLSNELLNVNIIYFSHINIIIVQLIVPTLIYQL